jgi:sporulation protein YlmC with PRC-barrel domain
MRTKLTGLVISSLLSCLLLSGPVTAQAPAAPVAGKVTLGVTVAEMDVVATGWRVSKLLRAEVRNDKSEKIGKIDDVVVAPDGTLTTAVIEIGGFLGMGAHRVMIPVRQLVFSEKAPHQIVLPGASKDALKALPQFKYTS